MYCEGGRSRTGRIGDRARPGIGRLALESGAAIVPVAVHGSSKVRNWRRLQFPKVTVRYGEPFRYEALREPTRNQQQAVADAILEEIRTLYAGLDELGRGPSLARARAERRARRAKRAAAA
jgi:1-acyl-sn-glycerol-3-phosphate acyltransferase